VNKMRFIIGTLLKPGKNVQSAENFQAFTG
jgi:hypothetical protein